MMSTFNNTVLLIGNLGKDVEVKTMKNGGIWGRVSMATNEYFKDKNGDRQVKTQWHKLLMYGPIAESMNTMLRKGSTAAVRGKISYGEYENEKGHKVYTTDIIVSEFQALDKAPPKSINDESPVEEAMA